MTTTISNDELNSSRLPAVASNAATAAALGGKVRPIAIPDFLQALELADSEMAVRRLILHSLIGLTGPEEQVAAALAQADAKANRLRTDCFTTK